MMEFIGGFVTGVVTGVVTLIGYGAYRAVNSDGWDDSNILNWLRLLSHCFIHPEDFAYMYYLDDETQDFLIDHNRILQLDRPFYYIGNDEFADNFPGSRP